MMARMALGRRPEWSRKRSHRHVQSGHVTPIGRPRAGLRGSGTNVIRRRARLKLGCRRSSRVSAVGERGLRAPAEVGARGSCSCSCSAGVRGPVRGTEHAARGTGAVLRSPRARAPAAERPSPNGFRPTVGSSQRRVLCRQGYWEEVYFIRETACTSCGSLIHFAIILPTDAASPQARPNDQKRVRSVVRGRAKSPQPSSPEKAAARRDAPYTGVG